MPQIRTQAAKLARRPIPAAERPTTVPVTPARTTPPAAPVTAPRPPIGTTTTTRTTPTGPLVSPLPVPAITTEVTREAVFMTWPSTAPTRLVISAVGTDRPGLMADLTETPKAFGLTIDTAMGRTFGGVTPMMGMMLVVSGRDDRVRDFQTEVTRIRERLRADEPTPTEPALRPAVELILKVFPDRPGVVHDVAELAAAGGLNITALAVRTCAILEDVDLLGADPTDATPRLGVTHVRLEYPTAAALATFRTAVTRMATAEGWQATWKDGRTPPVGPATPTTDLT